MLRAFIFDMDGVLFDTERISNISWIRASKEMGLSQYGEVINGCVGLNGSDTRKYFSERLGEDFPVDEFLRNCSRYFYEIIERDGTPVKPGAREILKYLKEHKIKIALATSSRMESAERHLKSTGLREYFDALVSGDMISCGKPAPDIYIKALSELGVRSEDALAVEDSPNGIKSAFKAGIKTIMIPDLIPFSEDYKEFIYKKFDSLLDVVDFLKEHLRGDEFEI